MREAEMGEAGKERWRDSWRFIRRDRWRDR